jgi:hypothetical protein
MGLLASASTNHRPRHRLVESAGQLLLWSEQRLKQKRDPRGRTGARSSSLHN